MKDYKYDVFISYSHHDKEIVNRICKAFDRAGITYFIDRGIHGAMEFPQELADAIVASSKVLFVASTHSYTSRYANSEVTFAFHEKEKNCILPYIIDGSMLPKNLKLIFANTHILNIRQHPIETVLVDDILYLLKRKGGEKPQQPTIEPRFNNKRIATIAGLSLLALIVLSGGIYWLTRPSATELYLEGVALYDDDQYKEAFPLLLKAAEMGYDSAQYVVGDMYYYGDGVNDDEDEALKWYRRAAEQGHGLAQYIIAKNLLDDVLFDEGDESKEALRFLMASAEQGVPESQSYLANLYNKGFLVEKNDVRAFELRQKAAMQGFPRAQAILGDDYLLGRGTEKDVSQAMIWYKMAAEREDGYGQCVMGEYYLGNYGGYKDRQEAMKWFSKSALHGNNEALFHLGNLYAESEEWTEATKYYQEAAQKGNANAMYNLGIMYWFGGYALPKNTIEGMKYLKNAAEKNNVSAMCLLGKIYDYGLGDYNKNPDMAKAWYEKAAARGNSEAAMRLKELQSTQKEE